MENTSSNILDRAILGTLNKDDIIYVVTKTPDANGKRDKRVPLGTVESFLFGSEEAGTVSDKDRLHLVLDSDKSKKQFSIGNLVKHFIGKKTGDTFSREDGISIILKPEDGEPFGKRIETSISEVTDYILGKEDINEFNLKKDFKLTISTDDPEVRNTISIDKFLKYVGSNISNDLTYYNFDPKSTPDRLSNLLVTDKIVKVGIGGMSYMGTIESQVTPGKFIWNGDVVHGLSFDGESIVATLSGLRILNDGAEKLSVDTSGNIVTKGKIDVTEISTFRDDVNFIEKIYIGDGKYDDPIRSGSGGITAPGIISATFLNSNGLTIRDDVGISMSLSANGDIFTRGKFEIGKKLNDIWLDIDNTTGNLTSRGRIKAGGNSEFSNLIVNGYGDFKTSITIKDDLTAGGYVTADDKKGFGLKKKFFTIDSGGDWNPTINWWCARDNSDGILKSTYGVNNTVRSTSVGSNGEFIFHISSADSSHSAGYPIALIDRFTIAKNGDANFSKNVTVKDSIFASTSVSVKGGSNTAWIGATIGATNGAVIRAGGHSWFRTGISVGGAASTDGINVGADTKFSVNASGDIIGKSLTLGGEDITETFAPIIHNHNRLYGSVGGTTDLNTRKWNDDRTLHYSGGVLKNSQNIFPATHNSNGVVRFNTNANYSHQLGFSSDGNIYHRSENDGSHTSWSKLLKTSDLGSGKLLDADTVDGVHAESFLREAAGDLTGGTKFGNILSGLPGTASFLKNGVHRVKYTGSTDSTALVIKSVVGEAKSAALEFNNDGRINIHNHQGNNSWKLSNVWTSSNGQPIWKESSETQSIGSRLTVGNDLTANSNLWFLGEELGRVRSGTYTFLHKSHDSTSTSNSGTARTFTKYDLIVHDGNWNTVDVNFKVDAGTGNVHTKGYINCAGVVTADSLNITGDASTFGGKVTFDELVSGKGKFTSITTGTITTTGMVSTNITVGDVWKMSGNYFGRQVGGTWTLIHNVQTGTGTVGSSAENRNNVTYSKYDLSIHDGRYTDLHTTHKFRVYAENGNISSKGGLTTGTKSTLAGLESSELITATKGILVSGIASTHNVLTFAVNSKDTKMGFGVVGHTTHSSSPSDDPDTPYCRTFSRYDLAVGDQEWNTKLVDTKFSVRSSNGNVVTKGSIDADKSITSKDTVYAGKHFICDGNIESRDYGRNTFIYERTFGQLHVRSESNWVSGAVMKITKESGNGYIFDVDVPYLKKWSNVSPENSLFTNQTSSVLRVKYREGIHPTTSEDGLLSSSNVTELNFTVDHMRRLYNLVK